MKMSFTFFHHSLLASLVDFELNTRASDDRESDRDSKSISDVSSSLETLLLISLSAMLCRIGSVLFSTPTKLVYLEAKLNCFPRATISFSLYESSSSSSRIRDRAARTVRTAFRFPIRFSIR